MTRLKVSTPLRNGTVLAGALVRKVVGSCCWSNRARCGRRSVTCLLVAAGLLAVPVNLGSCVPAARIGICYILRLPTRLVLSGAACCHEKDVERTGPVLTGRRPAYHVGGPSCVGFLSGPLKSFCFVLFYQDLVFPLNKKIKTSSVRQCIILLVHLFLWSTTLYQYIVESPLMKIKKNKKN